MQSFDRYIGIDYSGAETPRSSLKRLRVYIADRNGAPTEVPPPPSPRRYWTRREIAEWLVERLLDGHRTLIGIDHGFSFPLQYFANTTCRTIGRRSSTTFSGTGRRTRTSTLTSCATAFMATAQLATGTPAGDALRKYGLALSPSSTSTCLDPWQSPPMPGCPGYAISDHMRPACISGPSTVGRSPQGVQSWQKSIRLCGAEALQGKIVMTISTTPIRLQNGCAALIVTAHSWNSLPECFRLRSGKWRKSRAGYWELNELCL